MDAPPLECAKLFKFECFRTRHYLRYNWEKIGSFKIYKNVDPGENPVFQESGFPSHPLMACHFCWYSCVQEHQLPHPGSFQGIPIMIYISKGIFKSVAFLLVFSIIIIMRIAQF